MSAADFIFWGAKGHALVLAEIVRHQGGNILGLFDCVPVPQIVLPDVEFFVGFVGYQAWIKRHGDIGSVNAIAAIGGARGKDRRDFLEIFRSSGFKTPALLHHSAVVSPSATIGENSHILAGTTIAPKVEIGDACIINTNASVDHECVLAPGVHVAPGTTLCGCVRIGENTLVGAGSVVLPRVKIGANVVIGAGSVVTRDVPDRTLVFGNPARIVRSL